MRIRQDITILPNTTPPRRIDFSKPILNLDGLTPKQKKALFDKLRKRQQEKRGEG